MAKTIAEEMDGTYSIKGQITDLGGVWDDEYAVYRFPDGSVGRFTDIVDSGGAERTATGEILLHFIGWMPASEDECCT